MYLISLKHTKPSDDMFGFWRPDDRGYCISLENAGQYDAMEVSKYDPDDVLPIDEKLADRMSSTINFDGELIRIIPMNEYILKELKLRIVRKKIGRIKQQPVVTYSAT